MSFSNYSMTTSSPRQRVRPKVDFLPGSPPRSTLSASLRGQQELPPKRESLFRAQEAMGGPKRDSLRAKLTVETRLPDSDDLTSPVGGGLKSPSPTENLIFPLSPVRESEGAQKADRMTREADKKRVAGSGLAPAPFRFPLRQFAGGRADDGEHAFEDDDEPRRKGLKSRVDSAPSMDPDRDGPRHDPTMSRESSTASLKGMGQRQDSDSRLSSPEFGSISRTASNANLHTIIDTSSTRHEGFECALCRANPIVGVRYKCVACANFDLCANCEAKHSAALSTSAGAGSASASASVAGASLLSPPASPVLSAVSVSATTPSAAASACKHLFFIKITWPLSLPFMLAGIEKTRYVSPLLMNRSGWVHEGFSCGVCRARPIVGWRHQCSLCDISICETCEFLAKHDVTHARLKYALPAAPSSSLV